MAGWDTSVAATFLPQNPLSAKDTSLTCNKGKSLSFAILFTLSLSFYVLRQYFIFIAANQLNHAHFVIEMGITWLLFIISQVNWQV